MGESPKGVLSLNRKSDAIASSVCLSFPTDAVTRAGQKLCVVVYPQMDAGKSETSLSKETKEQLEPMCVTEDCNS